MNLRKTISYVLLLFMPLAFAAGCVESLEEPGGINYGYVQFKITKAGLSTVNIASKAGNTLDLLGDASKVKVRLRSDDGVLEQTVIVNQIAADQAEWGVWTEKLKLYKGRWTLMGYEIYDGLDGMLLSGEPEKQTSIDVVPGGLVKQDIYVNVRPSGYARFEFVKRLPSEPVMTRASSGAEYRFDLVCMADISIRHEAGNRTDIKGVSTKVEYFYTEKEDGDGYSTSSRLVCDTSVFLPAGKYTVEGYTVYDKGKKILETMPALSSYVPAEERTFTVSDNAKVTAKVPVTYTETSPQILDGIALKKLWLALDGPNWNYRGRYQNKGCNWDFDRDIDLWTAQPGVSVLDNGRVASISLACFGAKGEIPEGILSQFAELRSINLGFHDDFWGDTPGYNDVDPTLQDAEALRKRCARDFSSGTPLAGMAKEMRDYLPSDLRERVKEAQETAGRKSSASSRPAGNIHETYSSYITKLPEDIGTLTNLTRMFIANSPLRKLPESIRNLKKLTDLELFNCPQMTEFPKELAGLENLQGLYFVSNKNIPAQSLYDGLDALAEGGPKATLQMLYFMDNNLEVVPASLAGTEKLSSIDFSGNRIHKIERAFGKRHNLGTAVFSDNRLTEIPVIEEADGSKWFAGIEAVETWDFSGNELTELPNIFDATEPFYMGTVTFARNKIASIEGAATGEYRGVNAEILDLSYNRLEEFPVCIYNSAKGKEYSSKINYLIMRANGMREFKKEALEGANTYYTQSMDLSFNRLQAMPANFHAVTFPYMYGLDLTANAFSAFPFIVLDISKLTVLILRSQRDDEGYRSMDQWPAGIGKHKGLNVLYLGGNDIGKVQDGALEFIRFSFEITDNPRISIDLSPLAPYIRMGIVGVLFDEGQDVRGL